VGFPLSGFDYRDGALWAEEVALTDLAQAVGTPFYCYSTARLEENYRRFAGAFAGQRAGVCYALKANSNLAVVRTLAALGAGGDVVSAGEMERALAAGIPADRVVFSGVGKTADEMAAALTAGIHQFNVESVPELETLNAVAVAMGRVAPIAIRVNPDVDAHTHAKIATGKKENKFGIDWDVARAVYAQAAAMPGIRPVGIAVHIGSQLTEIDPFRIAFRRVADLLHALRTDGLDIDRLDLGGGLGVAYNGETPPTAADYADMVGAVTGNLGCAITLEPGRALVADAGLLVTRAIYVKQGAERRFLVLDAAMNDLIRPALYDAWHPILPVRTPSPDADLTPVDVVGPVCESGDTFALQRALPPVAAGDLMAIGMAGAYGAVMSSTYNTRPLVPEVQVNGADWAITRPRQTVADLMALERRPSWQAN
jgi:diaminopimelate decarboxylase